MDATERPMNKPKDPIIRLQVQFDVIERIGKLVAAAVNTRDPQNRARIGKLVRIGAT